MAPDANRPGGEHPGDGHHSAHQSDEQLQDTAALCEVVGLVARLGDRVLDLERRLAAAKVPHAPTALDRQRRRSAEKLAAGSPVARFVRQREEVLG
jgi:hypothetical protein